MRIATLLIALVTMSAVAEAQVGFNIKAMPNERSNLVDFDRPIQRLTTLLRLLSTIKDDRY